MLTYEYLETNICNFWQERHLEKLDDDFGISGQLFDLDFVEVEPPEGVRCLQGLGHQKKRFVALQAEGFFNRG
jgi:hypothetical protein